MLPRLKYKRKEHGTPTKLTILWVNVGAGTGRPQLVRQIYEPVREA